ncbi:MAG: prepilin peptidase [bacterium]
MDTIFDTIFPIIFFFFGAIIGSFLNVVILRYRSGRSITSGRSVCFTCGRTLHWFEMIPIGSFLSQGGRCEGCKTKISWQYPIVEALTGTFFVLLYFHFQYLLISTPLLFVILFTYYAIIISILLVLSVYDIRHKILPDRIVLYFVLLAFIGMFFVQGDSLVIHIPRYTQFLAGILLPAPFTAMWFLSKGKWMGLGDSKLMVGIGFLLGLSAGFTAILFSFWIGAIVSIIILIIFRIVGNRGVSLATAIPFGPFLALGTIIVLLGEYNLLSIFRAFGGY